MTQAAQPIATLPAAPTPSPSQRFTLAVDREFTTNAGEVKITSYQKKLIQNYFIKIDMVLKDAEIRRLSTQQQYRDPVPVTWENINMPKLATDAIAYSGVGLDPSQDNHINVIPYKNNKTGKYDITFIVGYRGQEVKARKYGFDIPDDVVVELVYSNDKFQQFKKDMNNKIESYLFEVVDNFNRGEIVGGFYYHKYFAHPEKNKLKVFSKADIMKRKPKNASAEFWGGEKAKWENGQRVGVESIEGWLDEMAYKTIFKAAYKAVTIDSEKIDAHFLEVIKREQEALDNEVIRQIAENANGGTAPNNNASHRTSSAANALGFDDEPPVVIQQQEPAQNNEPVLNTEPQQQQPQEAGNSTKKAPF